MSARIALLSTALCGFVAALFFLNRPASSEGKEETARSKEGSLSMSSATTLGRSRSFAIPSGLRGHVVNSEGLLVSGATVCVVVLELERNISTSPNCVESDGDGEFSLNEIAGTHAHIHATRVGVGAARVEGNLRDWVGTDLVLRLEGASNRGLLGKVVDSVGGPIPGATIEAVPVLPGVDSPSPDAIVLSDGTGGFLLPVVSRQYEVIASAAGYGSVRQIVNVPSGPVEFALGPECQIRGNVVNGQGQPLEGVRVVATRDGIVKGTSVGVTDRDGSFLLGRLIAGTYFAGVSSDSWEAPLVSTRVLVGGDIPEVRIVAEERLTFEGSVAVDGAPCESGSLVLEGPVLRGAELDTQGIARVTLLIPGTYKANISCNGALPESEKVEIRGGSSGNERSRRWELRRGLSVSGRVRGADGLAREGLSVHVELAPGSEEGSPVLHATECKTDERGQFACGGLERGAYRVSIQQGFRELLAHSVNISSDTAVDWSLPPLGALRVTAGADAALLGVLAEGKSGIIQAEREDGSFWLRDLPPGPYEVRFTGDSSSVTVTVRGGPPQDITLQPPALQTLSGSVVGPDGQPVPDAWVRVSDGSPFASARDLTAQTDAEGSFTIPDVPSGEYEASVETEGGIVRKAVRTGKPAVLRMSIPSAEGQLAAE